MVWVSTSLQIGRIITLSVQLVPRQAGVVKVVQRELQDLSRNPVAMGSIVKFVKETYRTKTLWEAIKAGGYRAGYDGTVA